MKTNTALQMRYGGFALVILGPCLVGLAGVSFLAERASQGWPTATARVVRSTIEVSKKASGLRRGQAAWSDYFTAAVEYQYTVDGKQYTGDRIHRSSRSSSFDRSSVQQWTRKYPKGAEITIHYSPRHPSLAVIDPTPDVAGLLLLFVGGAAMIPVGFVLLRVTRHLRPAAKQPASYPAVKPAPLPAAQQAPLPAVEPAPLPAVEPATVSAVEPASLRAVQPVPQRSTGVPKKRQSHWLLRTIVTIFGVAFFFLGAVVFPKSAELCVQAIRAPGSNPTETTARFITMAMIGGIALLGAYLICKGTRRATAC